MAAKRSTPPKHGNKRKLSVSPDPALLAWVMERTGPGKEYASITHAVERGWVLLREHEEGRCGLVKKK